MSSPRSALFTAAKFIVELDPHPFTPGTVHVKVKDSIPKALTILDLELNTFVDLLLLAQKVASKMCSSLNVQRCAMVGSPSCDHTPGVRIIPLHGLKAEWREMLAGEAEFNEAYPGYISSNSGPQLPDDVLSTLQKQIRSQLSDKDSKEISNDFHGEKSDTNLFARLIRGEIPQWRVWEDSNHVAFLTPFPNTPGFTVVIPRKHLPSDIFSLKNDDYIALIKATYRVGQLVRQGLPNACSCGIIFEGFEIDYAHTKLIPILGDPTALCKNSDFCELYQGYVSSKAGKQLKEEEIKEWVEKLKIDNLD